MRANPCSVPSNSDRCVMRTFAGSVAGVDREAVVLAGDHHATAVEILHRMIRAVMAELHLERFCAARESEQLMAEADAEYRNAGIDQFAYRA